MNLFRIYFRRNAAVCCILILLLTLAVSFCSLGVTSLASTEQQLRLVSSQYTTIAVPSNTLSWINFLSAEANEVDTAAMENAPGFLKTDDRGILGAYIPGSKRVTSFETEDHLNNATNYYNTHLVVLAARCDSVEPHESESLYVRTDENGNEVEQWTEIICGYEANFTVLDTLIRNDAYKAYPLETFGLGGLFTSDLQIPFTEGKTYLMFGMTYGFATEVDSQAYQYIVKEDLSGHQTLLYDHGVGTALEDSLLIDGGDVESDGRFYGAMSADQPPIYQEYEGNLEDFLASEEGSLWRETWIPMCERNYASANILLTDNIYSILAFNDGTASILDGRDFTQEDYETGAQVCMVSSAYAQKNGLSLGDTLNMDLYTCDSALGMSWVQSGFSVTTEMLNLFEPLKEENKLGMQKDYTIVGIYSAPEFPVSRYAFDCNTILVPKNSVPDSDAYEQPGNSLLISAVLDNGSGKAFLEALEAQGYENVFEVFDMGYSTVAGSLIAARDNALRLFIIGLAVFLLSSLLFYVIILQRLKPVICSMRNIGVKPKMILGQLLAVLLGSAACAVAVGTVMSAALFGQISGLLLSGGIALSPSTAVLCAGVQLAFLMVFGFGLTRAAANQNLMQRR